jgi:hypothetical protein
MIAWLDALRRRDAQSLTERLDPETTWQGVRPDLVCDGREEIVQTFVAQGDQDYEVDTMELIGAPATRFCARPAEPREIGGITAHGGM